MTTPPEPMSRIAKAVEALSGLAVIAESTVGYRRTLIEGGVSPEVADEMAKQFHTALIQMLGKHSA